MFFFTAIGPEPENLLKTCYFRGSKCKTQGGLYKRGSKPPKKRFLSGFPLSGQFEPPFLGHKSDFFAEQKIYSYGIIYKYISARPP